MTDYKFTPRDVNEAAKNGFLPDDLAAELFMVAGGMDHQLAVDIVEDRY